MGRIDDECRMLSAMMSGASKAKGALEAGLEKLAAGDFERPEHKILFEFMGKLHKDDIPVDMATMGDLLAGHANKIELIRALVQINDGSQIVGSWRETLKRVLRDSSKARLVQLGEMMQRQATTGGTLPEDIANGAMAVLADIAGRNRAEDSPQERARAFTAGMEEAAMGKEPRRAIPTGFQRLDGILDGGLDYKALSILAARPSMGKTALSLCMGWNAVQQGKRVLFLSLEQSEEQIRQRMVSALSGVLHSKVRNPATMSSDELSSAMDAARKLETELLVVDDAPRNTAQIVARIAYEKQTAGLDLCVVDHLGMIRLPGKNRVQELGDAAARLKDAAKANDVGVLALCQLSRAVESGADKRPMMSHLRDSGELEQTADLVALLYRPAYYDEQADRHRAELSIAKNRSGRARDDVVLRFSGAFMLFSDPIGADSFGGRELTRKESRAADQLAQMGGD